MRDAIMLDMDGTAADKGNRHPFDWKRVGEDTPRLAVIRHVKAFLQVEDADLLVVSGRSGTPTCRWQTSLWVNHWITYDYELFMRDEWDFRPDNEVKSEIYLKRIKPYWNVIAVWDDRVPVVNMWRNEHGLDCFQVAPGDF